MLIFLNTILFLKNQYIRTVHHKRVGMSFCRKGIETTTLISYSILRGNVGRLRNVLFYYICFNKGVEILGLSSKSERLRGVTAGFGESWKGEEWWERLPQRKSSQGAEAE